MNRNIKLTVISCLILVALVLVFTYLRITENNSVKILNPSELRELGALIYEKPVDLSEFSLRDQNGEAFTQENLRGVWTLFFFGFTHCPDICPLTLTELSQFYGNLKASERNMDTQVVMVSVDPVRDTTPRLKEYMAAFDPDFIGLNGDYEQIAKLARELYIAHTPPPNMGSMGDEHAGHTQSGDDYLIDHSGNILIIDPQGKYQGFFDTAIQDDELSAAYSSIRANY